MQLWVHPLSGLILKVSMWQLRWGALAPPSLAMSGFRMDVAEVFFRCLLRQLWAFLEQAEIGPEGRPELFAPPVAQLTSDFPQQPSLLGNLVPHQINLWMGAAPSGETAPLQVTFLPWVTPASPEHCFVEERR